MQVCGDNSRKWLEALALKAEFALSCGGPDGLDESSGAYRETMDKIDDAISFFQAQAFEERYLPPSSHADAAGVPSGDLPPTVIRIPSHAVAAGAAAAASLFAFAAKSAISRIVG